MAVLSEIKKTLLNFLVEKVNEVFGIDKTYMFMANAREEYVFPYAVVVPTEEARDGYINATQRKHYRYAVLYIQRYVKPAGNEIITELFEKSGDLEAELDGKVFNFTIDDQNLSVKCWIDRVEYAQPNIVSSYVECGVRITVEFEFVTSLPCE